MTKQTIKFFCFLFSLASLSSCDYFHSCKNHDHGHHHEHHGHTHTPKKSSSVKEAIAIVTPTRGSNTHGMVFFKQEATGVKVTANIFHLTPGKHGFHIHEYGDCSAPDATSAGDHYNPLKHPHAGLKSAKRHAGDFGNLVADETGTAHTTFVDKKLKLSGRHSILGRSVIIHAQEDDLSSQPTGNAGARIACGIIGIKNPKTKTSHAGHHHHH